MLTLCLKQNYELSRGRGARGALTSLPAWAHLNGNMLGGPDVAKAMGNRIIWLLFTVPGVLPGNQNTFLSLIPSRPGFEQLQAVGNKWQVVLDVSTCEIAAEETTAPLVCTDGIPRLLGVMILCSMQTWQQWPKRHAGS